MASKYKNNAMAWINRNADVLYSSSSIQIVGKIYGKRFRITDWDKWIATGGLEESVRCGRKGTIIQIGSKNFDRWANSVCAEVQIDLCLAIQQQIHAAISSLEDGGKKYD